MYYIQYRLACFSLYLLIAMMSLHKQEFHPVTCNVTIKIDSDSVRVHRSESFKAVFCKTLLY